MRLFGINFSRKKRKGKLQEVVPADKPLPKKVKIAKIPRVKNLGLVFKPRPGVSDFEQPEYDLAECGRVADVDSYCRRAFRYKEGLMFKEGWEFVGKNPRTISYIKERFRQMDQATGNPHKLLLRSVGADLIHFSNAFLAKVRKLKASGGKPRKIIGKKKLVDPVAGYFIIPPTTLYIKRDDSGKVLGYKQVMPSGKQKQFTADQVIHFYFDRKSGFLAGTPSLVPVLDDIRALRRIEENVELLVYQHLFPLFHYIVGTEQNPAGDFPDGTKEVDVIKAEIEDMPAEGAIVTPERHEIRAIGAEGRALQAESYLKHFKQRVFSGLGVSSVDMGEGDTSNRSTAETLSRTLIDDVKSMQRALEIFLNEYVIKELLLESTFPNPLDDKNLVEIKFKEIDLDAQIKVENHAIQSYAGHAITETELRRVYGKEPLTDQEREDTFWKRIQEPQLIISSLDEKFLDEPAAANPALAVQSADVQRGRQEREKERKAKAAKSTSKAKSPKKTSGQRASASKDRPSNQHGRKLSPEKRKSSLQLTDAVAPGNRLTTLYDDFEETVKSALHKGMFDENWLRSTAQLVNTEMREKLLRFLRQEFRGGFRSSGAALTYDEESYPFSVLEDRAGRYVSRLLDDLTTRILRIIEDIDIKEERERKITNVFDALRYRSRFIYASEKNKARNYGRARGIRRLGYRQAEIYIHADACDTCKAREKLVNLENIIIDDVPGFHPNCYSDDTEVLTENGFKLFKDLNKTELIASLNPKTFNLEYLKPISYIVADYQGELLEFRNRWFNIRVTPDHQMFTEKHWSQDTKQNKWEFIEARNVKSKYRFYRSSKWQGKEVSIININGLQLPTDLFCKFMGYYLAEGSVSVKPRKKPGDYYQISIAQHNHENREKILADLANFPVKIDVGVSAFYLFHQGLAKYLKQFGKSRDKYIPSEIKQLPSRYIRLFLDAFRLGDGNTRIGAHNYGGMPIEVRTYSSSSRQLIEGIGELILKVGKVPSFGVLRTEGKIVEFKNGTYQINGDQYLVSENNTIHSSMQNAITERIPYNGKVYCVELPRNHTLYVRREGKCLWSGNCRCRVGRPIHEKA